MFLVRRACFARTVILEELTGPSSDGVVPVAARHTYARQPAAVASWVVEGGAAERHWTNAPIVKYGDAGVVMSR
ncbi:hypothetical protein P3T43_001014 [Paraburkholderia sp. GAS41]